MQRYFILFLAVFLLAGFTVSSTSCIVVAKEKRTRKHARPTCGPGWHAVQKPNGRWTCKKNKKPIRVRDHRKRSY
ncbi:MAG: hypothetical protein MJE77_45915 [Proteobacteria bacterium]|nr:hypothetical protein [Pseudomonadota bacterium]